MFGALFRSARKRWRPNLKAGEARAFFEQNFRPVRISPLGTPDGFVTGYYEPIVDGTRTKGDGYEHPLIANRRTCCRRPHGGGGRSCCRRWQEKRSTASESSCPITNVRRSTMACSPAAIWRSAG
jgi:hypothetical protein